MEQFTKKQKLWLGVTSIVGSVIGVLIAGLISGSLSHLFGPKPFTGPFPMERCKEIASAFFSDGARKNLAKFGYSGDFPVSYFEKATQYHPEDSMGIALWFCLDSKNKEFFLALEPGVKQYNGKLMPDTPTVDLIRPVNPYKYTGTSTGYGADDLEKFFTKDRRPVLSTTPIANGDAVPLIKEFHATWEKTAKYNFSFFAENKDYDIYDCIKRAGKGGSLRYYIGYEEKVDSKPTSQKLRVMLVAVDKNGVPRFENTTDSSHDGMLQASWPPPPSN